MAEIGLIIFLCVGLVGLIIGYPFAYYMGYTAGSEKEREYCNNEFDIFYQRYKDILKFITNEKNELSNRRILLVVNDQLSKNFYRKEFPNTDIIKFGEKIAGKGYDYIFIEHNVIINNKELKHYTYNVLAQRIYPENTNDIF